MNKGQVRLGAPKPAPKGDEVAVVIVRVVGLNLFVCHDFGAPAHVCDELVIRDGSGVQQTDEFGGGGLG
jgi:hypothetical protein